MAIEWMDNFSQYGTSTSFMLNGLYAEIDDVTLPTNPDGVSPGRVAKIGSTGSIGTAAGILRRVFSTGLTTVGIGARYWLDQLPQSSSYRPTLMAFNDINNSPQVSIVVETTGVISAYRGKGISGTLLGSTSSPVVVANAWNYIEFKAVASNTVGTLTLHVNGIEVLALTGQDTLNTAQNTYNQVVFCSNDDLSTGAADNSTGYYLNDTICWNSNGSYNNDFMGDVKVVTLLPNADVSFNWTPSTGTTGFNLIDETTPLDTDYIQATASPIPSPSTFGLSNLDDSVTSVKGLMTVARMLKTDGGDANVQVSLVSGGVDDPGADRPITTAATYWFDISETDPDTSAPWDPLAVNDADLKINRTV